MCMCVCIMLEYGRASCLNVYECVRVCVHMCAMCMCVSSVMGESYCWGLVVVQLCSHCWHVLVLC